MMTPNTDPSLVCENCHEIREGHHNWQGQCNKPYPGYGVSFWLPAAVSEVDGGTQIVEKRVFYDNTECAHCSTKMYGKKAFAYPIPNSPIRAARIVCEACASVAVKAPYYVEVDKEGCEKCGHDTLWSIVYRPDDCAGSASYGSKDEADDLCSLLNDAFDKGRVAGLRAFIVVPPAM